jgi:hypothetical protein
MHCVSTQNGLTKFSVHVLVQVILKLAHGLDIPICE